MRRREFLTLASGALIVTPLASRAQPAKKPVIGFLGGSAPKPANLAGFRQGLGETGLVDGRNVSIEYRWAGGDYGRLPALAADLAGRGVAVIAALASSAPGLAAKRATSTIPIVFQTGSDPVEDGLVPSMSRPGGNITGVTRLSTEVEPKRLELLHEIMPAARKVAFLVNPTYPAVERQVEVMQEAAHTLGLGLHVLEAGREDEVDAAFGFLARQGDFILVVATDPFLGKQYRQIIDLAARHAVPASYFERQQVEAGGLTSYAASLPDSYRQAGTYVGRILKGENPAELPILQPTKFELAINLKTAAALGLTPPPTLLALADEVIE